MNRALTMIGGVGIGAGLMYFLDPDRGRRRRARARDKMIHGLKKANEAIDKTTRDLANRLEGLVAEAKDLFDTCEIEDDVLVAQIRSKLGRLVSHARAIDVTAHRGRVSLSGPILAREADNLIRSISSIHCVKSLENRLELHESPDQIPSLQGGRKPVGQSFEFMQQNWSPSARLMAGTAGLTLVTIGARQRGLSGSAACLVGLGLLARALTNMEFGRLIGANGRRGVDIHKTINISAPVEQVFEFWTRLENFPNFMRNVREVKKTGESTYHWKVAGPAGLTVEWDGEMTRLVPNELIAFKSLPGSVVQQAGIVRFKALSDGDTCVDIRMTYSPPAGAVGHVIAKLFGSDPKSEMNEGLMRMKTLIETGRAPRDASRSAAATGE